jgi:hypothetical protein
MIINELAAILMDASYNFMAKQEKIILGVLQNITKNINNKKWTCLIENCGQTAINSHLLQVNGILNNLIDKGHLIQIKPNDYFEIETKGFLLFKSVGIQQAISEYLFCNRHDTDIFKSIEAKEIDFYSYSSQLLFSYRSLCCELRKKMKNIEIFTRYGQSKILNNTFEQQNYLDLEIKGHNIGIKDMTSLKTEMENEFSSTSTNQKFTFKTFKLPLIKICVSAIFSPIHPNSNAIKKAHTQEQPLNTVFINVVPQPDNLYIIVGFHNKYVDKWILDYINSWDSLDLTTLQNNLTNLLATKVETWSISQLLFGQILKKNRQKLEKYWDSNAENLLSNQQVELNLFEGTN